MADIQYEVNLDAFKEPFLQPQLYEGYGSSDYYVNTSAITSAQQFLPEFTIDSAGASYTHAVEKGDTYWKVARNVLMSQMGTDNPSDVKNSDIAKMMDQLIAFNGETRESANHLKVGQAILIPKELGEAEAAQVEAVPAVSLESGETQNLTDEQRKALNTASNGIKIEEVNLNPVDGTYNPLQPPGLEQGRSGDYDTAGFWNYDIEGRKIAGDITNKFTGMRTLSYEGQVDSGYGANSIWWNDSSFNATENINANGVLTYRRVDYQDSSVKMNFEDGTGSKVTDYIRTVESRLDPASGKYNSRITTVDGKIYSMQVDGQTGEVIRDSISSSGVS
ncbi:MAG: hypothetical protein K2Y39_20360 [Candidatus Obscuribacterales bacterium]|nr:hypothetical protein [Candidatus Obscuribacterales bacterium]